jgi:hypothetical protein
MDCSKRFLCAPTTTHFQLLPVPHTGPDPTAPLRISTMQAEFVKGTSLLSLLQCPFRPLLPEAGVKPELTGVRHLMTAKYKATTGGMVTGEGNHRCHSEYAHEHPKLGGNHVTASTRWLLHKSHLMVVSAPNNIQH